MTDRLLTPSKISSWLGCGHYLTLTNQVESGLLAPRRTPLAELADILIDKGVQHESRCLEDYEAMGKTIYEVPGRNEAESFQEWVTRVGDPTQTGFDVIYQMPFVHDGIRGIADFLLRVEDEGGHARYEPVDAKLTRDEARPGHVLQLCFYAEAMAALTGAAPRHMHLWLGSGRTEELVVEEFAPYWRRLRRQLRALLEAEVATTPTRPQPCATCDYCEFQQHCAQQWRDEDALAYLANARENDREVLEAGGVRTIAQLAERTETVADLREEKFDRLQRQASLQVRSRRQPDAAPAFELIAPSDDPVYGHGFEFLPAPDDGDVFFDFEGDPFWTAQHELLFLAGLYYRENDEWRYDERWAHSLEEQRVLVADLVTFFAERQRRYPAMHVYHYNHTERSSIARVMRDAEDESLFSHLVEGGLFVDLYTVARNAVVVGVESYGLKHLERLGHFERAGDLEGGAAAVVAYESWMTSRDDQLLEEIARYNRDDVAATKALRDWLLSIRPGGLAFRDAVLSRPEYEHDTDELVARLIEWGEGSPERLLADLLTYWRRERSADVTPKYVALHGDHATLYDHVDYVAGLRFDRFEEPTGRARTRSAVFRWPEQTVDHSLEVGSEVLYAGPEVPYGAGQITAIDFSHRELALRWGAPQEMYGGLPTVLVRDRYFRPGAKVSALKDLARQVLDPALHGSPRRLSLALLESAPPRFAGPNGPRDGRFVDDLDDVYRWIDHLDESLVAFQGPPGTGKTFSGSHVIHHLIRSGKRVGVVAMSHPAIDNLLSTTHRVLRDAGDEHLLHTLRWHEGTGETLDFATYSKRKADLSDPTYNLIGGTAWLWASQETRQSPVDVLVVDEAGQLSLADALASTNGARSMVLLGDPLQLAQVAKADHPGGSGASVLQHVLGEHLTVPDSKGVFLTQTRRMHPDVCAFISEQIYEGRLSSHESCARQTTAFGTGLRWLRADHVRRSTESPEEASVVAQQIRAMVGTPWTNADGDVAALVPSDFMVVAPYNDQVRLLRDCFEADPSLAGVQVGTVDKFQGREAPVVFFTMTTSSASDMPRGPEFLFSRNRLNVAVSRARCLAYLVCTEELLNSRAADIDDMRLIATLSAFVEHATKA